MLFEAEFRKEIDRQLAEKKSGSVIDTFGKMTKVEPLKPTRFVIAGDDANQTLMWRSLMKDCAFYFDVPTLDEERSMRKTLQGKYDGLFQPGWRPPLTSRRDLMTWACKQYNTSLEVKGAEDPPVDCENY